MKIIHQKLVNVANAVFWEKCLTLNEHTGKEKGHQWPNLQLKKPAKKKEKETNEKTTH